MKWNNEQTTELRLLWTAGKTAGQIAQQLGFSRSAVAGKLYRLGLLGNLTDSERQRRRSVGTKASWSPERRQLQREILRRMWAMARAHGMTSPGQALSRSRQ